MNQSFFFWIVYACESGETYSDSYGQDHKDPSRMDRLLIMFVHRTIIACKLVFQIRRRLWDDLFDGIVGLLVCDLRL